MVLVRSLKAAGACFGNRAGAEKSGSFSDTEVLQQFNCAISVT